MEELELGASFEVDNEHMTGIRVLKRGQDVSGLARSPASLYVRKTSVRTHSYAALSATKATLNAKLGFFAVFPIKTQARVFGVILLSRDLHESLRSMKRGVSVDVRTSCCSRGKGKLVSPIGDEISAAFPVLNTISAAVSRSLESLEMILNEAIERMIESLNFPDASWICYPRPVWRRTQSRSIQRP